MENKCIVSVIIVNYNTTQFTEKCVRSILNTQKKELIEIIVVDNNSTDRSVEILEKDFPEIKLYKRQSNDGFAAGCNYGSEKATGEYLLFVNPDVVFGSSSIELLMDYLTRNESAGILSGVMLDESDNVLYFHNKFPDFDWELRLMFPFLLQKRIDMLIASTKIENRAKFDTDWFHGAFMFMRKMDFESAGKFNEQYFMYYEDVELCYKMKTKLNKKIICIPEFRYYHSTKSSLSEEANDNIYTFHLNRSKLLFIKNYKFFKRMLIKSTAFLNIVSRLIYLPFWRKYASGKSEKYNQLKKIVRLYFSDKYLYSSKYEFIVRSN